MKTTHYYFRLLLFVILSSFNCYGGTLIIENDYPELRVVIGSIDGRSFGSINGRSAHHEGMQFEYTGRIILYYAPKTKPIAHMLTDLEHFLVVDIEDFFENPGHHIYSQTVEIDGDILSIEIEVDGSHCTDNGSCYIPQKQIQDFYCKVVKLTLNGIELPRETRAKKSSKMPDDIEALFDEQRAKIESDRAEMRATMEKMRNKRYEWPNFDEYEPVKIRTP